jgi:hypothetical protein
MSLDYTLDISTDYQPAEMLDFLVDNNGFVKLSEKVAEKDGVIVSVYSQTGTGGSDERARSIFHEAHGFTSTVAVCFQPSKFDKKFTSNEKYTNILWSSITLLDHFSGNAVLLANGDQTVLRRINGHLQIDIRWYEGVSLEGLSPDNFSYLAEKYS